MAAIVDGDPFELNRYGYTANNPINRYDPTGSNFTEYFTSVQAGMALGGALVGFVRAMSVDWFHTVLPGRAFAAPTFKTGHATLTHSRWLLQAGWGVLRSGL